MSNKHAEINDQELLALFAQEATKHKAFEVLVDKYQRKIYYYIRKMVIDHDDADDITQDVFLKAWKNLEKFKGEAGIYTWLYRIATNETLNFLTKKRKRYFIPFDDVANELENKLLNTHNLSGDEISLRLERAILRLPDKQRVIFNLRYFEEMPYKEMQEVLGTSEGGLKASFHQAVKKLEKWLGAELFTS